MKKQSGQIIDDNLKQLRMFVINSKILVFGVSIEEMIGYILIIVL